MHLIELLYYGGLSVKKYFSLRNQKRLPCAVISIGNITVGGTGKTPATMAIADEAKKRGYHPVILTRGYGGRARGPCFVTRGDRLLLSVEDAGDEPALMAERLEGIPIVKGPDRYGGGLFALRELRISGHDLKKTIFVLDDGFQHWRLHRDRDIVLIDRENPFGSGLLLPFGRLREPLSALSRADVIVLTKSGGDANNKTSGRLMKKIRRYNTRASVFSARHAAVAWRDREGLTRPPDSLRGKRVLGFCALGDPLSFKKTITLTGAELAEFRSYRDHSRYNSSVINEIAAAAGRCGAEWIVTTEKDIIKIKNMDLPDNILVMEIAFSPGDGFYEAVFDL